MNSKSKARYEILDHIDKANGSLEYVTLSNQCSTKPDVTLDLLVEMRKDQLVSGSFDAYSYVKLTSTGKEFLLEMREHKADKISDRRFQIINTLLGALAGGITGSIASLIVWLCT